MKIRLVTVLTSILLIFASCSSDGLLLGTGISRQVPASSVIPGSSVVPGDEIPVTIDIDAISSDIDLVRVELRNSNSRLLSEVSYEGEQLSFPDLPALVFSNLETGIYELVIELFENGESRGRQESWFFYTKEELEIEQIVLNPHSVFPGERVQLSIDLGTELGGAIPYFQFRLNDAIIYQGSPADDDFRFEFTAPISPGIYDLAVEIFPWFDARLNDDSRSTVQQSLELLVNSEADGSDVNERIFTADTGFTFNDDPFSYESGFIASRISMQGSGTTDAPEELLRAGGDTIELVLRSDDSRLDLIVRRGSERFNLPVNLAGGLGERNIVVDLLEGERNLSVLVSEADQLLAGEIFSLSPFEPDDETGESPEETTQSIATGFRASEAALSSVTFRSIYQADMLESFFKLILRKKYGNFVLYAEGFEFESAVNQAISYSENAYIAGGYLNLPPDSWVELPDFALDEYLVEFFVTFHPDDDLSLSELILLQEIDGVFSEVFVLNDGQVSSASIPQGERSEPSTDVSFSLSREDERISLLYSGIEYGFPSQEGGRFRIFLNHAEEAGLQIRLDSVSGANAPDEFIDRVFETDE